MNVYTSGTTENILADFRKSEFVVRRQLAADYDALAARLADVEKALLVETDRVQDAWKKQWAAEARLAELEAIIAVQDKQLAEWEATRTAASASLEHKE